MTVAFAGTGIQTRQTPKDLHNGTAGPAVEGNNDTVTLPRARLNDAPSRDQLARGGTCRKVRDAIASWAACPTAPSSSKERHGHLFNQAREIAHVFSFGSSGT